MSDITIKTLDRLRAKYKCSDYRVAQLLEVGPSTISNWRNERSGMSEQLAMRAAELLDEPPGELYALLAAEKSTDEEARRIWTNLARLAKKAAAASVIASLGITGFQDARATQTAVSNTPSLYIMSNSERHCISIS